MNILISKNLLVAFTIFLMTLVAPLSVYGESKLYVINNGSYQISVIDTTIGKIIKTISSPVKIGRVSIAYNPRNNLVYWPVGDNLFLIDANTDDFVGAPITIGPPPNPWYISISPELERAYISHYSYGVSVINTTTNTLIANIQTGYLPAGSAFHPVLGKAYIVDSGSQNVSVINMTTNSVIKTISGLGYQPGAIQIDTAANKAVVGAGFGHGVWFIDTLSDTVVAIQPDFKCPIDLAVDSVRHRAYLTYYVVGQNNVAPHCTDIVEGRVAVLDTVANTVLTTLSVGLAPNSHIALNAAGNRLYVPDIYRNSVFVVDTTTDSISILAEIPAGIAPIGVAVGPDVQRNVPPVAHAGQNISVTTEDYCRGLSTIQGTASDPDTAYSQLTYRWLEGANVLLSSSPVGSSGEATLNLCNVPLSLGQHTLTLEVTDGQATASDKMILTIDNSAPHSAPTGGGVYQIGTLIPVGGQVSDFDGNWLTYTWSEGTTNYCSNQVQGIVGGTPVNLPDCVLPPLALGTHVVVLTVSDGINQPVSSNIILNVVDTTAPTLAPEPSQSILWPPNHNLIAITINANASDNSGLPSLSAIVSSDEPQDGLGDGDIATDWTAPVINQQTGVITLQLRAERSGLGEGRTYTVVITATDTVGNTSAANVEILVPHDQGKRK